MEYKMRNAQYLIVEDEPNKPLIIQDIGPWDEFLTVTNDAEQVVEALVKEGRLPAGRRLLYFDSEYPDLDELLVRDGKFAGFHSAVSKG
jgi:hypothetical protein